MSPSAFMGVHRRQPEARQSARADSSSMVIVIIMGRSPSPDAARECYLAQMRVNPVGP